MEIGSRIQHAIEELTGNEALLEMLETDAAVEMLAWGKALATSAVERTEGMDELAADQAASSRLKAVRQFMRSVGNWAAGKYTDPEGRIQLRNKLLEQLQTIFGNDRKMPSIEKMDAVLNSVDDRNQAPSQLISTLKTLFEESI